MRGCQRNAIEMRLATDGSHGKFRTSRPSTFRTRRRAWMSVAESLADQCRPKSGGAMSTNQSRRRSHPPEAARSVLDLSAPSPPLIRPRGLSSTACVELILQRLGSLTASCFVLRHRRISQSAHCDEVKRMTPRAQRAKVRCVSHTSAAPRPGGTSRYRRVLGPVRCELIAPPP